MQDNFCFIAPVTGTFTYLLTYLRANTCQIVICIILVIDRFNSEVNTL